MSEQVILRPGGHLTGEREEPGKVFGFYAVSCQIFICQSDHRGQISTGRVPGYKNHLGVAAKLFDMFFDPRRSGSSIVNIIRARSPFARKPVINSRNCNSLVIQRLRVKLIAPGKTAPVEPDNSGKVLHAIGSTQVQFAAFTQIFYIAGYRKIFIVISYILDFGSRHAAPHAVLQKYQQ